MHIIKQMGILLALCFLCQGLERILPFPMPASVLSILLVLGLLLSRALKTRHIKDSADFFLGNLPIFFIPVSVGIIQYKDLLLATFLPFLAVCLISSFLTFACTAWAVQWCIRRMKMKHGEIEEVDA